MFVLCCRFSNPPHTNTIVHCSLVYYQWKIYSHRKWVLQMYIYTLYCRSRFSVCVRLWESSCIVHEERWWATVLSWTRMFVRLTPWQGIYTPNPCIFSVCECFLIFFLFHFDLEKNSFVVYFEHRADETKAIMKDMRSNTAPTQIRSARVVYSLNLLDSWRCAPMRSDTVCMASDRLKGRLACLFGLGRPVCVHAIIGHTLKCNNIIRTKNGRKISLYDCMQRNILLSPAMFNMFNMQPVLKTQL